MKDTIIYNMFMILVATIVIAITIAERLEDGAANGFLVYMSIFSVFAIVIGLSNIRSELHIRR